MSESEGVTTWTWWPHTEVGHNQEATKEVNEVIGQADAFDNPKPTRLIRRILQHAADKDSLVLDSFAVSATTAHAVLSLNKEAGGNRRFILIECEDYADSITAERVRRVFKGYKKVAVASRRVELGKTSIAKFTQWLGERDKKLLGIYATLDRAESMDDVGAAVLEGTVRSGVYNPKLGDIIRNGLAKYVGEQSLFGITIHADALK